MIELSTTSRTAVILLLGLLSLPSPARALTIYRIGGESLDPPPVVGTQGVQFVQRSWADLDPDSLGTQSLTQLGQEFLAPMWLDPEVNLLPLLEEMGGALKIIDIGHWAHEDELERIRDGDLETAYYGHTGISGNQIDIAGTILQICCGDWPTAPGSDRRLFKLFNFDLGGTHRVGRFMFRTRPGRFEQAANLEEFYLLTNAGDIDQGEVGIQLRVGKFYADIAYHITENQSGVIDLPLAGAPIRYVLLMVDLGLWNAMAYDTDWEIAEVEMYGDGYTPRASYQSNVIDLGGPASLGDLSWAARVDPGARLELRARTGDDADPNYYYRRTFRGNERSRFDRAGDELTRAAYDRLEGGEKAGTALDTESWEYWTVFPDVEAARADLASAKPRQFIQFATDIVSGSQEGAQIDYLQFEVTQPPLVDQVLAEIEPFEAAVGDTVTFALKLLPVLSGENLGFDSVEIRSPVAPVSVDAVRVAGDQPAGGFRQDPYDGESFVVHFQPPVSLNHSSELVEIVFVAEVFQVATTFSARIFDSTKPYEVRQRVTPGDADPNADGNTLTVRLSRVVHGGASALRVSPPTFTPNGDGVNDELHIEYDLINLVGVVPVLLEVYDLAGRRLAQIPTRNGSSGRFGGLRWDGRMADGDLAPPGSYLLCLAVQADVSSDVVLTPFRLVY